MGMFYCSGCDRHHDSKDGEYNVARDGREYCDATLPASHTPTPWRSHNHADKRHHEFAIMSETGDQFENGPVKVASVWGSKNGHVTLETAEANAAFIVKAVNCHDELVAALEQAEMDMEGMLLGMNTHDTKLWGPCLGRIKTALTKAKEA